MEGSFSSFSSVFSSFLFFCLGALIFGISMHMRGRFCRSAVMLWYVNAMESVNPKSNEWVRQSTSLARKARGQDSFNYHHCNDSSMAILQSRISTGRTSILQRIFHPSSCPHSFIPVLWSCDCSPLRRMDGGVYRSSSHRTSLTYLASSLYHGRPQVAVLPSS